MSPRTTRNVALSLVGSAALLTLFYSCSRSYSEPGAQAADGTTTPYSAHGGIHQRHYARPWFSGWGWGRGWGGGSSGGAHYIGSGSAPRSGGLSSGTGSHSVTSRGGFGGTGHSAAS